MTLSESFNIPIPQVPTGTFSFTFSCNLPFGTCQFLMRFFSDVWNLWVTLPTGEIRQAGFYPNVASWTGFSDYVFFVLSSLDSIGQDDLPNVGISIGVLS